jgi:small subunit ribosomal protein S8
MSLTDPISNMLAAIKNGQLAFKQYVTVPASKHKKAILKVLEDEGYIKSVVDTKDINGHPSLKIELKYFEGEAVIKQAKRLSTPGRRRYSNVDSLPKVHNGLGIIIVSTSKGVMSDFDARQKKLGGELLCSVF